MLKKTEQKVPSQFAFFKKVSASKNSFRLSQTFKFLRFRQIALISGLPILGIVTAYAVDMQSKENLSPVPISKVIEKLAAPEAPVVNNRAFYWKDIFVQKGDTVSSILENFGKDGLSARNFLYSHPISSNLLRLHIDQPLSVMTNDAGELVAVQFFNDNENGEKILVAIENQKGEWKISANELETETVETVKLIKVRTSARGNLAQEGVPADVREALSEIFSDQFSLNDLKKGDTIRLVYESLYFRGHEVATGNILVADVTKAEETFSAYFYRHNDETGTYYDAAGRTIKQGFESLPVQNARVSSNFGMRRHPVIGGYRLHAGVDYAAPTGTPITAPSDGVVVERGVKGGYGNAIMLEHKDGLQTLYAHMSRFQSGINVGQKVRAGTVIGYVGATGRVTGPHLHYEVRMNGRAVDPSTSALPTYALSAQELTDYFKAYNSLNEKLALIKFDFDREPTQKIAELGKQITQTTDEKPLANENVTSVTEASPVTTAVLPKELSQYYLDKMFAMSEQLLAKATDKQ